ncbi:MAG: hypothetical protein WC683_15140 [bacterium]
MPRPYTATDEPHAWRCVCLPCSRIGLAQHIRSHRMVQLCEVTGKRPGSMRCCPLAQDAPYHGNRDEVAAIVGGRAVV